MHLDTCATVGEKNITPVGAASVLPHCARDGPDVAVERAMTAVEATHVRLTRITQVVCEDALLCARIAFIELRRR
ncbi:hypothetical protein GUF92_21320 [Xanthomonas citri pv. citri]|uniref:hypothetical protein n=1 Tax=Xanthomonas TaxID=338 RepID=UPI000A851B52|nr:MULTISPECIES: hypothetical protein [Xanthomonas]KAB0530902.1 hypothetical protein F7R02_19990 [Xanthomonas cissicola]MBD1476243.1 hypothetical protein [Xanthomonas citri pv. citri]MBD1484967.1 hypothetical protein [Xanthomonas citri pv. citri]MBD1493681.1 hypothetical protein [Xanthomonas citri pv. citri]MBD1499522.1 hypothetical protein [Xanthomonas citri pv. citri]